MLTRIICTGLLLGLSLSVQSPAAAKDAPEVAAETLRYEAWTLRCEARADLKVCGAMSTITLKDQDGNPEIAMVAMLRSIPRSDKFQLSIDLPLSVWLPSGVSLTDSKGKELLRLPFLACHSKGCQAGAIVTRDQIKPLIEAGDPLTAVYQLQIHKRVQLGFSMKGFAEAYAELVKRTTVPAAAR